MCSTWMRDRHIGPKDNELIRKGEGEQKNASYREQDCTRKHTRSAHDGAVEPFQDCTPASKTCQSLPDARIRWLPADVVVWVLGSGFHRGAGPSPAP